MYADFFGLRELPFNNTPDPRFFYSTPDHEEALASLVYAVRERKGFVLLTGEVGAGKTLVSRMMLRQVGTHIAFANINHAVHDATDLMETVCTEFEIPFESGCSNAALVRKLQDYLLGQFAQNTPVVLMLDEGQNLPVDALEQLRMIGNLEADDAKLLQIVIVGQPELQRMFASRELRQLRQRIFRSFHLPALTRDATGGYLAHRLRVAGGDVAEIFTSCAIDAVFAASGGLPRLINTICDNAMLSAYSADRRTIDGLFVQSVVGQALLPEGDATEDSFSGPASTIASARTTDERRYFEQSWDADKADRSAYVRSVFQEEVPSPSISNVDNAEAHAIAQLVQRIPELAQLGARLPSLVTHARSAASALRPLVAEARAATARAEQTSATIQEREASARKLASKTQTLIAELRAAMSSVRSTADDLKARTHDAAHASQRLVAQTDQARGIADSMLTKVTQRLTGEASHPVAKPADHVLLNRQAAETAVSDPDFPALLSSARQSLSELRSLRVQPADTTATPQADAEKAAPHESPETNSATTCTDQLAAHVDELVSIFTAQDSAGH